MMCSREELDITLHKTLMLTNVEMVLVSLTDSSAVYAEGPPLSIQIPLCEVVRKY